MKVASSDINHGLKALDNKRNQKENPNSFLTKKKKKKKNKKKK